MPENINSRSATNCSYFAKMRFFFGSNDSKEGASQPFAVAGDSRKAWVHERNRRAGPIPTVSARLKSGDFGLSWRLFQLDASASGFDIGLDLFGIFLGSRFFQRCRATFDHFLGFHQ